MSAEDIISRARDSYERDARFRAMAQSCVAAAVDARGRVDPERADGDAYEIALLATATLLQRIYEEDAELNALRAEIERLHAIAKTNNALARLYEAKVRLFREDAERFVTPILTFKDDRKT